MELLVIRHGIAEDREAFARTGSPDELRPLTAEGRRRMRRAARGLRREVPQLRRLASSPLLRAAETAQIVADAYDGLDVEIADVLAPDVALEGALAWIADAYAGSRSGGTIAIVGHDPHLPSLVTWLVSGREASAVELKKGGACLLAFDRQPVAGGATLRWLLTAGQLRGLR